MTEARIRPAEPADAAGCAAIVNDWIDATAWMPRVHGPESVLRFYADHVVAKKRVFVAGHPPQAFLALDDDNLIIALYSGAPGRGLGKALLDHVKTFSRELTLWTFKANTGAQRFYEREGFAPTRTTDGDNEEGLPDILYAWEAARA